MHIHSLIFKLFIYIFITTSIHALDLNWNHDYNKALQEAKKEHKLVYLFVGADHCKYCSRFYKWTLSKKEVIEKMKKDYVLLYMSRDKHKVPARFERYGVPRHYFLTPKGTIVHEDQGSREKEGWYDILDEVDLKKDDFINK